MTFNYYSMALLRINFKVLSTKLLLCTVFPKPLDKSEVVYLPESIHIWIIVTLEGWLSHDSTPPGFLPLGGTGGKNTTVLVKISQLVYTSEIIHIWIIVTLEGWHLHHYSRPRISALGFPPLKGWSSKS